MSIEKQQQTIKFLSKVSFFSEITEDSLAHLSTLLTQVSYGKNSVVFKKDDLGDSMFIILEGAVKIHDKEHIYDHLGSGDCFGEYALIDNNPRSATVTTTEACRFLKIEREMFIDLMAADSGLAQGVLAVMIKRHRDLDILQSNLAASRDQLAIAHEKLSALIEGAMDAIIMFDTNFKILITNPSAHKLLENDDVLQRNVLFFLDENSATTLETLIAENEGPEFNAHLPEHLKVIGSNETEVTTEGTLSRHGKDDEVFFTLILRDIEGRLKDEQTIQLLTSQTNYLKKELNELTNTSGIIAKDESMLNVLQSIQQVAATNATVLITGETGTGKELVARAIHHGSLRKDKPLIRINCGAIPTNLIESELFGHEKGAFTGATASRKGRFLLADGGTIFLDEIAELPLDLQPKLLRVIQEGEFDPVGSSETIKVDVRIIAATHRDLLKLSQENSFREDLYYRLNVFPISIPPLRERGEDICLIAEKMVARFAKQLNKPIKEFTDIDREQLLRYQWPGNVRELQNLIERAVIISKKGEIDWDSVLPSSSNLNNDQTNSGNKNNKVLTQAQLIEFEKANILKALKKTQWKVSGKNGAAQLLKIAPTTLASKIKSLGITRPI